MKTRIYYKPAVPVFWLIFLFFSMGITLAHPGKRTPAQKLIGSSRTYYINSIHGSDDNSGTLKS